MINHEIHKPHEKELLLSRHFVRFVVKIFPA
jgi:hypothetical protein